MKRLLLNLVLAISAFGYSQAISVNTGAYTVPQLVNNVLINSPCVSATNITWSTGSNFGTANGIGFFQNSNPNFPMNSGVILSTGNVMNAVGPNTSMLNDGNGNWPGDASLEATLAQSGISMNSTNATVLEFDFTPISPTFSFEFLFASEEYGNFQCQFSDAFAFLLTNTNTGVTTNLAVVPSTNLPISVVTIRDFLYNSSCPSANAQYFGSFNGGSSAFSSATNFNGQTKLMNASAVLVPNTTYHIKLVIADRADESSDSAIFISSDTFNIGQDVLGLDLSTANNTAVCYGSSQTLNSNLDPAQYNFSWTRNGQPIAGENGPSLVVNQAGTYAITYQKNTNGCQPVTDYINVEFLPEIAAGTPSDLYRCDMGNTNYTYDLSYNTPIVKAGLNSATQVSYHASQSDADAGSNALPNNYTATPGTTVYVRIKNPNNACYTTRTFNLLVSAPPVANQPGNMTKCSGSAFNNAGFDLNQQTNAILGGQSATMNVVTYYSSLTNANSHINPINNNYLFANNNTPVFARVENAFDSGCYSIVSFNLLVTTLPQVDTMLNVFVCDSYTLPTLNNGNYFTLPNGGGTALQAGEVITQSSTIYIFNQPGGPNTCSNSSSFSVTILDPNSIAPESDSYCGSYSLPTPPVGGFFTGSHGTGTQIPAGTRITSTQTINFYFVSPEPPFCVVDKDFTITILPTISLDSFANVFGCTSYTLPELAVGSYYTEANGQGTQMPAGTVLTASQTVYVYAATPDNCTANASFEVIIGMDTPENISQCEPYVLPALPIGNYYTAPLGGGQQIAAGTAINLSQTIYIYAPVSSGPNCTDQMHFDIAIAQPIIDELPSITVCDSFTLPALTNGEYFTGQNGSGQQLQPGYVVTSSRRFYIFKRSTTDANCSNQSTFQITIKPKPFIDSRSDIDICDSYTLTDLTVGRYYTGPGGTGTMLPSGTVITTSQTIYIYAVSVTEPYCTNENSFNINVYSIQADAPADVVACDSYTLPALTSGKYYRLPGGPNSGEGSLMHAGDVLTSSQTVYVYAESGERINCSDENSFTVTINTTPVVHAISDVQIANAYTLPALTVGDYYTGPNKTGQLLHAGDVLTTSQTLYVYAETGTTPNCSDEKSFDITVYNVDELPSVTSCSSYILPALTVGGYYTGPLGTGTHLNPGQAVTTTKTIYIYGVTPFDPNSYDQSMFTVNIVNPPVAYPVPNNLLAVCDEDGNNDGITEFDLTTLTSAVLGTQTGSEFVVTYHPTFNDAVANLHAVTTTELQTIYVRVTNTLATNCFDVKVLTVRVNKIPEPQPVAGIMCYDSTNQVLLRPYVIPSGLNASNYAIKWYNQAGDLVGSGSTYQAVLPGEYTVIATDYLTGCSSAPTPVTVLSSEPAIVAFTQTDAFDDNQVITVEATGAGGDYEYQLDFGPYQDSPIFQDVASGTHTISVRDKNGCGITKTFALIVNYPKFFTPNGDGYNDTWNINSLKDQSKSVIYIYDRYGKFISQIKPGSAGWDGTINGNSVPADDYWFTITYNEDGQEREFKSHFAIKR
ncbi:T9SS type B sorting domain-containing protein [Flavobacterium sp. CYK-55]|uniref:T9SS type B sorting domain-containing protein n=1 Tax=Flavobacterium sp. CYK-55 TaxID=2835529 RepID=UPI001BCAAE90|nr:choice-of-anchor L domain-containing protein [Flavobacterium sp. CYK-55]MBS7786352.1 T9SS type B sorting domain-containing protein [Flavobacterium sp. CYK-55]